MPGRPGAPLSRRLLQLVAVVALPLMLLGAGTLWLHYRADRTRVEAQLTEQARGMARLVDREFDRAEGAALALAASAALARGDLATFGGELRAARDLLSAGLPGGETAGLAFFDAEGMRRLDTAWPSGEPRVGARGVPHVQAAIASGRTRTSDLVSDPEAGPPGVAVAVPVRDQAPRAGGHRPVIGAVVVTVPRERLLEVVTGAGLPSGAFASVQDRRGITVARSFRDAETLGRPPAPAVLEAIMGAEAGLAPRGTRTLEGVPSTIAFARAPASGFIVTLDVPEAVFLAPFRSALLRIAAVGAVMLAAGLALALLLTRRIVAAFRRVPHAALDGAARSGAAPVPTGLHEADELAASLATVLAERGRADASLRALFDSSPVGIAISGTDGRLHQANEAFLGIIGRARTELEAGAVRWDAITPPEWAARDAVAIAEALGSGRCTPYEKEYLRPDGSRVPVLLSFGMADRDTGLAAVFAMDLSERRAAEAALAGAEALARARYEELEGIYRHAPVGLFTFDREYRFTRINERMAEINGLTVEDHIGRSMHEVVPDLAPYLMEVYRPVLERGEPVLGVELHGETPGAPGIERHWLASYFPLRSSDGAVVGLIGAVLEVTERRRVEAALAEGEARLRRAQEVGRVHAFEIGRDLVARCDDGLRALFGLAPGASLDFEAWEARLHPEDRAGVLAGFLRLSREGGAVAVEYRILLPDASVCWLLTRAEAVLGPGGEPGPVVGVTMDVTDRRRAEEALRESEARFRAVTDAMPQMVWSTRPDGYHDFYNRRWYDFTGTTPEQVLGEGWNPVFHPDDRERAWARWSRSLETGEPYEIEYRLRAADGSYRWMLGRALPVRAAPDAEHPEGRILRWFGTCTDIEEIVEARDVLARSRAEMERLVEERTQALQVTQARLAHVQRMEALGQLAGGIAHDFNNVLQAVQGGAALIERRPADPEGVRRLARMVFEAAGRGAAITRRLLAFSRRGDLRAEAVDPVALLTDMREILTHTLGTGVGVRVEAPSGLPPLLADKGQLETVLVNLATNARDAMAGNGVLTLAAAVEVLRCDDGSGCPIILEAGSYLRLSVADTGAGMAPEVLARATEPFFTTKPQGQGTGLGLAMARGFAEQSGGGLHVESAPGRGTTVRLWFPLAEGAPATAQPPGETGATGDGKRARLLVVDDEPIVREVVTEGLEAAGYGVLSAADGPDALALLDAGEGVDLLVSDLSMPGMDGVALVREAQRRRPGLPAILLTGYATNAAEIAVSGAIAGTFSLLRKPVTTEHLVERVAVLLEGAAAEGAGASPAPVGRASSA